LFASKIADSAIEGNNLVNDKQLADMAAGQAALDAASSEAPVADAAAAGVGDDVNMEEVLGKGVRKAAESETASESQVETR
jgi:small subunit ribosomal protein S2